MTRPDPLDARALPAATWLAAALFFLSGGSALVYQVAWQRILALASGVGVFSVSVIVAAFLLGLGAGSHAGGELSLRLSRSRCLIAFAMAEAGVGVLGLLSPWLYHDLVAVHGVHLYATRTGTALVHTLALFPPTFLMGLSLPLLVRGVVRDAASASRTISVLYAVNMAGAAAGALAAPWLLVPAFGFDGACRAAALGNLAAAAGVLLFRDALSAWALADADAPASAAGPGLSLRAWAVLYAGSGFAALALEIVWFRLIDVGVRATAYTFGTVLAVYLAGSALGCVLGLRLAPRLGPPLRAFLACQCLLLAYAGLGVVVLAYAPLDTPVLAWLYDYWISPRRFVLVPGADPVRVLGLYGLFPVALFGPATVLMGLSFTLLQRAVQDDPERSGHRVGLLQAANIAGCTAGSLLVGAGALDWVGSAGTLRGLVLLGLGFAVLGARQPGGRLFLPLGAALLGLGVALPDNDRLWARFHDTMPGQGLIAEDATGVSAVTPQGQGFRVFAGGKIHSTIPYGSIHTLLGALPALVHPAPRRVALIGLGSGDTAWAAACRSVTREVHVFEVMRAQPVLLGRLLERAKVPELQALLDDPRLRLRIEDGRVALQRSPAPFDVIEADALWPEVAYAGNLYSLEFFELCASRLAPGGVMCTWAPRGRVISTFARVFPQVLITKDRQVLLGSRESLTGHLGGARGRSRNAETEAYLGASRALQVRKALRALAPFGEAPGEAPNTDLYPRDELAVPQG
jgi:spermidine synthase